jgi:hypothetical protein
MRVGILRRAFHHFTSMREGSISNDANQRSSVRK